MKCRFCFFHQNIILNWIHFPTGNKWKWSGLSRETRRSWTNGSEPSAIFTGIRSHFFWLSRQNKIQKSTAKTKLGVSYTIRAPPRHRYTVHVTLWPYNASVRRVFFIYFKSSVKQTWFDAEFQLILSVVPQYFFIFSHEVPVVFAISTKSL